MQACHRFIFFMTRLKDNAELLTINGVGEVKLERFGDDFLAVIAQF